jgi:type I restriction enzyme M protein
MAKRKRVDPADLMASVDIAEMVGVGKAAVANWQARHADFPEPVVRVANGNTPLWHRADVVVWLTKRSGGMWT